MFAVAYALSAGKFYVCGSFCAKKTASFSAEEAGLFIGDFVDKFGAVVLFPAEALTAKIAIVLIFAFKWLFTGRAQRVIIVMMILISAQNLIDLNRFRFNRKS